MLALTLLITGREALAIAHDQSTLPAQEIHARGRKALGTGGPPQGLPVPLPEIARQTLARHFEHPDLSLEDFAKKFPLPQNYHQRAGVFVTLSENGKTRACWGSIDPQFSDLVRATIYTTEACLRKEYRFALIKAYQWQSLKPQVTIIRSVDPLHSLEGQNPFRDGLMVRLGSRGAVILPGEASDSHYQLVQCKLKAGIPVSQPCQLYRITADVLH
jgi:AMMECR1 domain-containing protein